MDHGGAANIRAPDSAACQNQQPVHARSLCQLEQASLPIFRPPHSQTLACGQEARRSSQSWQAGRACDMGGASAKSFGRPAGAHQTPSKSREARGRALEQAQRVRLTWGPAGAHQRQAQPVEGPEEDALAQRARQAETDSHHAPDEAPAGDDPRAVVVVPCTGAGISRGAAAGSVRPRQTQARAEPRNSASLGCAPRKPPSGDDSACIKERASVM